MLVSVIYLSSVYIITHSYNNGVGKTPAMGWNTWCSVSECGTDICNEDMIIEASEAIKSNGMFDVGYNRIHISDCWDACSRQENGSLKADKERFPNGIQYVNDIIHSYGLLTGIYTSAGNKFSLNSKKNKYKILRH